MSEEPLRVALRVLLCYTTGETLEPKKRDLARLRRAAQRSELKYESMDDLAGHIVRREVRRRQTARAAV